MGNCHGRPGSQSAPCCQSRPVPLDKQGLIGIWRSSGNQAGSADVTLTIHRHGQFILDTRGDGSCTHTDCCIAGYSNSSIGCCMCCGRPCCCGVQYEGPLYDGGDAVLFITHNEQRVRLVKSGPPTPCSPRRISSGRARLPAHPTGSDEQGAGVVPYIPPADPNKQQLFHGPLPVPAASAPGGAAAYTGGMLLQPQQPVMGR